MTGREYEELAKYRKGRADRIIDLRCAGVGFRDIGKHLGMSMTGMRQELMRELFTRDPALARKWGRLALYRRRVN